MARLHAVGDLRVGEEPVPAAAAGMSLVQVTAVGICGSDLHWRDEGAIGDAVLTHPLVLGYEGAGVISDGPRRGERVSIDPAISALLHRLPDAVSGADGALLEPLGVALHPVDLGHKLR